MELLSFTTVAKAPDCQTPGPVLPTDTFPSEGLVLSRDWFEAQKIKYPIFSFPNLYLEFPKFLQTLEYFSWNAVKSAKLYFNFVTIRII